MFYAGIDIGSTASKAVVMDGEQIVQTLICDTGYNSRHTAESIRQSLADAGYTETNTYMVATGYGRVSVPFADRTVTEITCHAKGAAYLFGEEGTVIDIGGQDTKGILLRKGKVMRFVMNDKCSAGTGKFLEIMANRLGLTAQEMSAAAETGERIEISSMCTVFAESEVISLIGKGTERQDIAAGVYESVVNKVAGLLANMESSRCFLTGGLCEDAYLLQRLSAKLGTEVESLPLARYAGAIGAAIMGLQERDVYGR